MLIYILIVVAFGATLFYISSRVRRAAREAFESETVERDEFVIVKPEGFINPINDESAFAFEAYSKDFGKGEAAENLRQTQIFVSVFDGKSLSEVCEEAKNAGEVLPESDENTCLIKTEETLENAPAYKFCKIVESRERQKVYELKILVLQDALADYQNRIDETLASFRLK